MSEPGDDLPDPLPVAEADPDDMAAEHFPGGQATPHTALGAAFLWWQGLQDPEHYREALHNLSLNPTAWGDYSEASGHIRNLSIMTEPIEIQQEPEQIAGIKFVAFGGESVAVAFYEARLEDVWVVTLVRPHGETWWRVWGLSYDRVPTPDDVFGR